MKKKILVVCLLLFCGSLLFAKGRDKIGAYLGWPAGLNYSHEFTTFVELDLLFGFSEYGLHFAIAPLFTIHDPIIDGQRCPLSIGPSIGVGAHGFWNGGRAVPTMDLAIPLRWEIFFKNAPKFNFFMEFGPGVSFYLRDSIPGRNIARFNPRGGIGLRAVL